MKPGYDREADLLRSVRVKLTTILVLFGCIFFYVLNLKVQASEYPISAPLNPEFVEWAKRMESNDTKNSRRTVADEDYAHGYFPSPVDLSHLRGLQFYEYAAASALPSNYDLRSLGRLTPVKNQGQCGSCWTFAAYASVESSLLANNETADFSEQNMKNTHGLDSGACSGGNLFIATAYLGRWHGPVNESEDPYNQAANLSPSGLVSRKHLQEVLFIPERADFSDNDNIKQTVMTYGALYTSMYMDSSLLYSAYNTYYYNNTREQPNHAVAIVGWDDNFDKAKFNPSPPGNGAFVVRNSYGAAFGEAGYFYVSYFDTRIATNNAMFNGVEPTSKYGRVYQYDPLGMTSGFGYSTDTAWFSNVFTATAAEQLSAVSFYTMAPNASYVIYIYTNAANGPASGGMALSQSGTISMPGYHTIPINNQAPLIKDQNFSVVVRLTTPNYYYPVPIEKQLQKYSSQAKAAQGQSYVSKDGVSWSDLTTLPDNANTNVCLKAFTTGVNCTYALSDVSGVAVADSVYSITLTASSSDCRWSANSSASWLTISNSTSSGSGSGTINYTVAANNTYYDRTAYINVEGQIYTVTQPGLPKTAINILQNGDFESGGNSWLEKNSKGYAIITSNPQTAHGGKLFGFLGGIADMMDFLYQDITIPADITTAYLHFWYAVYTEEAWDWTYPTDGLGVYAMKHDETVILQEIATFSNLDANRSGWSWVQSPKYDLSAFKGQTIRLMVFANNDSTAPSYFFIDDMSLDVISSGSSCTLTLTPSNSSFTGSGGSGDINVVSNSADSCSWAAYSTVPWISITSGGHGSGSGKVSYSVSANIYDSVRTGTISIFGNTVTITQAAIAVSENKCAASVSEGLTVHIPILIYNSSYFWADLQYNSSNSTLALSNAGAISGDTSAYSNCISSTMSSGFKLHIPSLNLNGVSYWLDLQYTPTTDGLVWFAITGAGAN